MWALVSAGGPGTNPLNTIRGLSHLIWALFLLFPFCQLERTQNTQRSDFKKNKTPGTELSDSHYIRYMGMIKSVINCREAFQICPTNKKERNKGRDRDQSKRTYYLRNISKFFGTTSFQKKKHLRIQSQQNSQNWIYIVRDSKRDCRHKESNWKPKPHC